MRSRCVLLFCAFAAVACGGSSKDSLEKKVKGLQDEVTRLQNSQDRVAERLQSLELQTLREKTAAPAPAKEDVTTVTRPPLKVVKLAPGASNGNAEATSEAPEQEDESAQRPVLRDYGQKTPAWQKAPGKPAATSGRAPVPRVSQNDSGAAPVTPVAPQGSR